MSSPFKFLDAYTREDRAIFFGRDREIEEMYQKVFSSKILLVYGISGTGKTSLINCGLANKFEDSDWLPVHVRRGGDIMESLWKELGKLAITSVKEDKGVRGEGNKGGNLLTNLPTHDSPAPGHPGSGKQLTTHENQVTTRGKGEKKLFIKAIQSLYLDHFKPIYLIFDQFEELFIFGNRKERDEFIRIVKEITDADIQCRFIFSIREEYLAGVTEFETVIPDFLSNRMRIEKMSRQHAIEAIEGPCRVHSVSVEKGFPEALLDKLDPLGKEVELTYLQVFLEKLYHLLPGTDTGVISPDFTPTTHTLPSDSPAPGHPGSGRQLTTHYSLSLSLLQQAGDVKDLLGSFLEGQINALDEPETGLTILKAFVSVQGTKRQVTEEEVVEFSKTLGNPVAHEKLTELIQRFVNLRILRDKDESNRYELRHDSLAAKIYEKITLVEKELLEVRQFIENALQTYEKRGILLSDKDLKYLQVYEDRLFLEGKLEEFVEQSKKAIYAKRRQFNNILRISLAGFILLVAGMGYYYYRKTSETKNIEQAIMSLLQAKITPALAYHAGLKAYRMDSTSSVAQFAILNAFYEMLYKDQYYDSVKKVFYDPGKLIFDFTPCEAEIISAQFSEDGRLIYGWLENNKIKIWDIKGKELLSTEKNGSMIIALTMSGNNKFLAATYQDSTGTVWDTGGEKLFSFPVVTNPVWNSNVVDFSPDNRFLAGSGPGNDIVIYDLQGKEYQRLSGHSSRINYISFSPDSRFISSASDDSSIILWNYNRHTELFGPYGTTVRHKAAARSCNFSKNSKYLLTASDDSTFYIWNLNGDWVYGYNLDKGDWVKIVQDKICEAVFSEDEELVMITVYKPASRDTLHDNQCKDDEKFAYMQTLMTTGEYYIIHLLNGFVHRFAREEYNEVLQIREVRNLNYNNRNKTIAYDTEKGRKTILTSEDLLPLRAFKGNRPLFSADGNYLLCASNNELCLYPASVEEIIRLVDEVKIFGKLNYDPGDWVNIF